MVDERPAPDGIDVSVPNVARIYDYTLGGKDNFAADRAAVEQMFAVAPEARPLARQNRGFIGRTVRFLAGEAGIRQFLDLGSGLPTQENVHEIAHRVAPDSRVVYVDYDPVAVVHGRALLTGTDRVTVVQSDLRHPEQILDHPEIRELIDFDEPVAVLLTCVLHFVTDEEDPAGIMATLRQAVVPGSYLVISHAILEDPKRYMPVVAKVYQDARSPLVTRTRAEVAGFFDGFDLVEPGLVSLTEWRPEAGADPAPADGIQWIWGAVGRKR